MRYFTIMRMAYIKNNKNNLCCQRCDEKEILDHCWWESCLILILWKIVWRFLSKLRIEMTLGVSNSLYSIYPGFKNIHSNDGRDGDPRGVNGNLGMLVNGR